MKKDPSHAKSRQREPGVEIRTSAFPSQINISRTPRRTCSLRLRSGPNDEQVTKRLVANVDGESIEVAPSKKNIRCSITLQDTTSYRNPIFDAIVTPFRPTRTINVEKTLKQMYTGNFRSNFVLPPTKSTTDEHSIVESISNASRRSASYFQSIADAFLIEGSNLNDRYQTIIASNRLELSILGLICTSLMGIHQYATYASQVQDREPPEKNEKAYQKQREVFIASKRVITKGKKTKQLRFVKDIGLGFKTPATAKDGTYVDKKCPFTSKVSIRGRILKGLVISAGKMKNTCVIRRDYLHFIPKYRRYEKRHRNMTVHVSPCFQNVKVGDVLTVGECRPLSKTIRFNAIEHFPGGNSALNVKKQFRMF